MKDRVNRFQELDALRGIASILVVLFHFTMRRQEAQLGFKLGTTGVDLFFIISGFVIFMSLTKVKNSRDFIINRISRLYPTYWTCVSFTFILVIVSTFSTHGNIPYLRYLGNMTMFQHYLRIPDLDGPYWTMIIEMIFYIAILFLFRYKLTKYLKPIGLTLSFVVVVLCSFLKSDLLHKLFLAIPLLPFIPLFFAGTIFYRIYTEKSKNLGNYVILVICLVCQIFLYKYSGRSSDYISHFEYALMVTLYFLLFTLFVNGKLKFIVSGVSLFLGKISFALYLIHQKVSIGFIIPILMYKFKFNFWIASLLFALPIVIGLAAIITYFVEVPFSQKMKESLRAKFSSIEA